MAVRQCRFHLSFWCPCVAADNWLEDPKLIAIMADAGAAGDFVQVHLCAIALGWTREQRRGLVKLNSDELERVARARTRDDARRFVAESLP